MNTPNLTHIGGNGDAGGSKTHKIQNSKAQHLNTNTTTYATNSSMDQNNDSSNKSNMDVNQL